MSIGIPVRRTYRAKRRQVSIVEWKGCCQQLSDFFHFISLRTCQFTFTGAATGSDFAAPGRRTTPLFTLLGCRLLKHPAPICETVRES